MQIGQVAQEVVILRVIIVRQQMLAEIVIIRVRHTAIPIVVKMFAIINLHQEQQVLEQNHEVIIPKPIRYRLPEVVLVHKRVKIT